MDNIFRVVALVLLSLAVFLLVVLFILKIQYDRAVRQEERLKQEIAEKFGEDMTEFLNQMKQAVEIAKKLSDINFDEKIFNMSKDAREYNLAVEDPERYMTQELFDLVKSFQAEAEIQINVKDESGETDDGSN